VRQFFYTAFWTVAGLIIERFVTHPIPQESFLYSYHVGDYDHVPADGKWYEVTTRHGWVITKARVRKEKTKNGQATHFEDVIRTVPWKVGRS
jgi:hypothetical protein